MATDESDEGSHLEVKSNSIFGPFLLSRLNAEENKSSDLFDSEYLNEVQRWSQIKPAFFLKFKGPVSCLLLSQALPFLPLFSPHYGEWRSMEDAQDLPPMTQLSMIYLHLMEEEE